MSELIEIKAEQGGWVLSHISNHVNQELGTDALSTVVTRQITSNLLKKRRGEKAIFLALTTARWKGIIAGDWRPRAPFLLQHLTTAASVQVSFTSPDHMGYCCMLHLQNKHRYIPATRFAFRLTDSYSAVLF